MLSVVYCRLEGDAVKLSWAAFSDDGGTAVLDWKVMHAELISTGVQVRRSTDNLQHASALEQTPCIHRATCIAHCAACSDTRRVTCSGMCGFMLFAAVGVPAG